MKTPFVFDDDETGHRPQKPEKRKRVAFKDWQIATAMIALIAVAGALFFVRLVSHASRPDPNDLSGYPSYMGHDLEKIDLEADKKDSDERSKKERKEGRR